MCRGVPLRLARSSRVLYRCSASGQPLSFWKANWRSPNSVEPEPSCSLIDSKCAILLILKAMICIVSFSEHSRSVIGLIL